MYETTSMPYGDQFLLALALDMDETVEEQKPQRPKRPRRKQISQKSAAEQLCLFLSLGDEGRDVETPAHLDGEVDLEVIEWTEYDVLHLHEEVLHATLRVILDGRASEATRQAALDWAMAELIPDQEAVKRPFSFQACCLAGGYDAEAVQDGVKSIVLRAQRKAEAAKAA